MDLAGIDRIQAAASADAFAQKLEAAKETVKGDHALHDPKEAGAAFEKLFATLLVKEMTKTLQNGFFGDGPGSDTFQDWLNEELGGALAKDGKLGIAEAVRESLIRKQASAEGAGGNEGQVDDGGAR